MSENFPKCIVSLLRNDPIVMVDVGARNGVIKHMLQFPEVSEIYAFEPETEVCDESKIKSPSYVKWFDLGLDKTSGQKTFYQMLDGRGNSLVKPKEEIIKKYSYPDTRMPVKKIHLNL